MNKGSNKNSSHGMTRRQNYSSKILDKDEMRIAHIRLKVTKFQVQLLSHRITIHIYL